MDTSTNRGASCIVVRLLLVGLAVLTVAATSAQEGSEYKGLVFSHTEGTDGESFESFVDVVIAGDGTVAFSGQTTSSGIGSGIWTVRDRVVTRVAGAGFDAPGLKVPFLGFDRPSISPSGRVAFRGFAGFYSASGDSNFGSGIFPESGLWGTEGTDLRSVLIPTDASVLGFDGGTIIDFGNPDLGGHGEVAVKIKVVESSTEVARSYLAYHHSGRWSIALAEGDPVPMVDTDLDSSMEVLELLDSSFDPDGAGSEVDINEAGQVVFKAIVGNNSQEISRQVILAGLPGRFQVVAAQGQPIPGMADSTFSSLAPDPSIASNGLVALFAEIGSRIGEPSPSTMVDAAGILPPRYYYGVDGAIFVGRPGNVQPVVRVGDPVPGGPEGSVFGQLSTPCITARGDIVFFAEILYSNFATRPSIWLKRAGEDPVLVASQGNIFRTPNGLEEVTDVHFSGRNAFNDLNVAAFSLAFESGEGIYTADTRSGYPVIEILKPATREEQVTTAPVTTVAGTVFDDSGISRVDFEVLARGEVKKQKKGKGRRANKRKDRRSRRARSGGEVVTDATWAFSVPLEMGRNVVSVWATDKLGNQSPRVTFAIIRWEGRRAEASRRLRRQ